MVEENKNNFEKRLRLIVDIDRPICENSMQKMNESESFLILTDWNANIKNVKPLIRDYYRKWYPERKMLREDFSVRHSLTGASIRDDELKLFEIFDDWGKGSFSPRIFVFNSKKRPREEHDDVDNDVLIENTIKRAKLSKNESKSIDLKPIKVKSPKKSVLTMLPKVLPNKVEQIEDSTPSKSARSRRKKKGQSKASEVNVKDKNEETKSNKRMKNNEDEPEVVTVNKQEDKPEGAVMNKEEEKSDVNAMNKEEEKSDVVVTTNQQDNEAKVEITQEEYPNNHEPNEDKAVKESMDLEVDESDEKENVVADPPKPTKPTKISKPTLKTKIDKPKPIIEKKKSENAQQESHNETLKNDTLDLTLKSPGDEVKTTPDDQVNDDDSSSSEDSEKMNEILAMLNTKTKKQKKETPPRLVKSGMPSFNTSKDIFSTPIPQFSNKKTTPTSLPSRRAKRSTSPTSLTSRKAIKKEIK